MFKKNIGLAGFVLSVIYMIYDRFTKPDLTETQLF